VVYGGGMKEPGHMETFNAKLPTATLVELRELAARDDRTVAALVRLAVNEYLERRREAQEAAR
jgi:predicted transcriptional regulator